MVTATQPRTQPQTQQSCSHHWIIEPASSTTSKGTYAHCGRTKRFHNSLTVLPKFNFDTRRAKFDEPITEILNHPRNRIGWPGRPLGY